MKKILSLSLLSFTLLNAFSIQEMAQETISSNPKMEVALSNYKATLEDLNSAKARYYPSLDLLAKGGAEQSDTPNTDENTLLRRETSLTLTENIFEGFGTVEQIKEKKARINAQAYTVLDQANSLSLKASEVYFNVLKEKALLDLAEDYVETHKIILGKIEEKTNAGLGKKSDVEQTKGRLSKALANLYAQQNNYLDAKSQFARVLGRDEDVENLSIPETPALSSTEFDILESQANEFNPLLKIVESNIETQKALYEQAKVPYYPTLDVEVKGDWNENVHGIEGKDESYSAMLVLKYNLFRGGSDEAQRLKNKMLINKELSSLTDKEQDVAQELKLALAANDLITKQLESLKDHALYTKQASDSYAQEYNLGRRSLIDLLNAELEFNSAKQAQIRAKFDLLYSKYRILSVTGALADYLNLDVAAKVKIYKD